MCRAGETGTGLLRIGSLSFRVTSDRPHDVALLAYIFKQRIQRFDAATDPDVALAVGTADAPAPVNPTDRLFIAEQSDGGLTLGTDLVEARLDRRSSLFGSRCRSAQRLPGAFLLHASVRGDEPRPPRARPRLRPFRRRCVRGRRYLFVGDKAAGKSTICLALGRLGGEILSDDHVSSAAGAPLFLVSGCEETSRVTPRTEEYIFGSLDVEAQDFGGMVKKEFNSNRFFRLSAYQDFPIDRVFFSQSVRRCAVQPMSRQAADDRADREVARPLSLHRMPPISLFSWISGRRWRNQFRRIDLELSES